MKKSFLYLIILFNIQFAVAQQCPVVPLPNQYQEQNGKFTITANTPIITDDPSLNPLADFLQRELVRTTGLTLNIRSQKKDPAIILSKLKEKPDAEEGYSLRMNPKEIRVSSKTEQGLFYGLISLIQITNQESLKNKPSLSISCWNIQDAPKYSWRGLMLDESRHFFGKETVKSILNWMAYYKLNRFHWHLTDAPGWRMEVKKYPKLTLVGGIGNYSDPAAPAKYYTQDDIREIIAYARERFITVIPEIDMPGHAAAANRAYPEFSGGGSKNYPEFTFNPGKEETYGYLTDILKETNLLFPSEMIHLGGDEVHFGNENWKNDPQVNRLMQEKKLADLKSVEQYFVQRMADSVFSINNKVLLWDEAAGSTLPPEKTIVFWWRHDKPEQLELALKKGFSTVLSPRLPFYFDFVQDSTQRVGRRWSGAFNALDNVYNFSLDTLPVQKKRGSILGVQGALWTEHIAVPDKLEYMLFPRICALAENAWTADKNRNLTGFSVRLKSHLDLFRKEQIYFYNPEVPGENPEPAIPVASKE